MGLNSFLVNDVWVKSLPKLKDRRLESKVLLDLTANQTGRAHFLLAREVKRQQNGDERDRHRSHKGQKFIERWWTTTFSSETVVVDRSDLGDFRLRRVKARGRGSLHWSSPPGGEEWA
jgi:hypothetical protein